MRGYPAEKKDKDFTYDDENIIYVIILKILESYFLEFSLKDKYIHQFIPLALEFYKHHVSPSDLILVNSMVRNLNVYFPNIN